MLCLIFGGAALQRCGNCFVLNSASAAEVALSAQKLVFPQLVTRSRIKRLIRQEIETRRRAGGRLLAGGYSQALRPAGSKLSICASRWLLMRPPSVFPYCSSPGQ